jgi:SAM-dependent methyltransferase
MTAGTPPPARAADVVWHEVECGGYEADLAAWKGLADQASGPILDLGCGTGRVALHLARRGHEVVGLDLAVGLIVAFNERAEGLLSRKRSGGRRSRGGPAVAQVGDARSFELGRTFPLVLAPMQLVQLFADAGERVRCLECVAAHLRTDGLAAFAIVEEMPTPVDAAPPLPDTREVDGWVYSSLPVEASVGSGEIRLRRLRQTVSPRGELGEELDRVRLRMLDAGTLEREAERAGLRPAGRRSIPATDAHVGSTVVLLEKEA